MAMESKPKSIIWDFFTISLDDSSKAQCLRCKEFISRGSADPHKMTSTNMKFHLKRNHKDDFLKLENLEKALNKERETKKKPTRDFGLDKYFSKQTTSAKTSTSHSNIAEPSNIDKPILKIMEDEINASELDINISCSTDTAEVSKPSMTSTPNPKRKSQSTCIELDNDDSVSVSEITESSITFTPATSRRPSKNRSTDKMGKDRDNSLFSSKRQQTLRELVDKTKPWDMKDQRSMVLHNLIAEMICVDIEPYQVVEHKGFQRLMHYLEPRYKIPSRTFFSENLIPRIYDKLKAKLASLLTSANYISFTSDIWTNNHNLHSFICLTAHWLTDDFEFHSAILKSEHFPTTHNATNIGNFLMNALEEWGIQKEKVHLIVRDNAANMVAALQQCGLDDSSLGCCIHSLQLCIQDKLFSQQRSINDMLAVARSIAGHFRSSSLGNATLRDIQENLKLPMHKIIQDVSTRWNSTFYMLERLVQQRAAITLYYVTTKKIKNLSDNQWDLLEKLIPVLRAFEKITRELSCDKASVSIILPFITAMEIYLNKQQAEVTFIKTILCAIAEDFKVRFFGYKNKRKLIIATVLDPRFKLKFFIGDERKEMAKKMLIDEYIKYVEVEERKLEDSDLMVEQEGETDEMRKTSNKRKREVDDGDIWSTFFEHVKDSDSTVSSLAGEGCSYMSNQPRSDSNIVDKKDKCKRNVHDYLTMSDLPRTGCPFNWWKQHKESFDYDGNEKYYLVKLAQQYLAAPPSSVYSERMFSTAGDIYEPTRSRLTPEHGEQLLFCHDNLNFFNFQY